MAGRPGNPGTGGRRPVTIADATGRHHAPAPEARILSLVPSLTETLVALGLGPQIVGRTGYCIHPRKTVKAIKSVGGTKRVNWRKVAAAGATHAVLNIDENPKEMAEELDRRGIVPIVTHPIEVADNGPLIRLLGALFGREAEAERLARAVEAALAALPAADTLPPRRVLYLVWKGPWMTVSEDTYISRMLALINWHTVASAPDRRYPEIEMTEDLLAGTDLVLLSSEPFPFQDNHATLFAGEFPAHAHKVRLVDGELLAWYGVRAVPGLDYRRALAAAEAGQ